MDEEIQRFKTIDCYYQILGVERECTQEDIKRAYKKLAIRFHPDKNSHAESRVVFNKISTAYTTLSDATKRNTYDLYGSQSPLFHPNQMNEEFEKVFRMFFRQNQTYQRSRERAEDRIKQEAQKKARKQKITYFMVLLIVLYLIYAYMTKHIEFSMKKNEAFPVERRSTNWGVPFYIQEADVQYLDNDNFEIIYLSEQTEALYGKSLFNACKKLEQTRKVFEIEERRTQDQTKKKKIRNSIKNMDMKPCKKYAKLYKSHPQYMDSLLKK